MIFAFPMKTYKSTPPQMSGKRVFFADLMQSGAAYLLESKERSIIRGGNDTLRKSSDEILIIYICLIVLAVMYIAKMILSVQII